MAGNELSWVNRLSQLEALAPFLNSLWQCERITAGLLRVGKGDGKGVGGVRQGKFGQAQKALHHFGDGKFLSRAVTHEGLFDFARRDLENFQARFADGGQRRAARLAHDQRGLEILGVKKPFHSANGRTVFGRYLAQGLRDFGQAPRMFPTGGAWNCPVRQRDGMRPGKLNDAVTGAAQGWIDSDYNPIRRRWLAGAVKDRRRDAAGAS